MKRWRKPLIVGIALLGFGAARMPFESGLSKELQEANLLPRKLEIGTRDHIGQTSSAVALGGLRTLVATFLNLKAFTYFTQDNWSKVAETFEVIVDLAPHTGYYWDSGAWYQYSNAAAYYKSPERCPLPALRRREGWRQSILRGRAFLERGIRNNPDDASLLSGLGGVLSNLHTFPAFPNRNQAFAEAADAYKKAINTSRTRPLTQRQYLFALARVPGREKEALAVAKQLYNESPQNRVTTLVMLLFVLEAHENPSMDRIPRVLELFGSEQKAYETLSDYWMRTNEALPVYGVAETLQSLEKSLKIPPEQSVFRKPPPAAWSADSYFKK